MPPRLRRHQAAGHLHFLTFSCRERLPYLAPPASKALFESVLESRRQQYNFHVYGYVVMPEHVHLLVSEPPGELLSKAIASLKREVSRQSAQTPFWLPRYYDFNVFSTKKLVEKLRYIHRNLASKPEDYPWSSFRSYVFHESHPVTITHLF